MSKVYILVVRKGGTIETVVPYASKSDANREAASWERQALVNDREGNPEDELHVDVFERKVE